MPLSLLNHSALALFAQRTRIPTSARSIGFCAIWVCISSSSEWNRAAVLKTADFTYTIGEIDLEPICSYRFTNYRNLKEENFQYCKWI
jgi:hypothetical protein